jgi:DNA (cytosine-5)-methyltransferase 1
MTASAGGDDAGLVYTATGRASAKRHRGMRPPRLLDLFCGAGGAGMGYHRAGFEVAGADVVPQPRYPFPFVEADAPGVVDRLLARGSAGGYRLGDFGAIHASPPCQCWAQATVGQRRAGKVYPDLIAPLRPRLARVTVPWVIENVPRAPLRPDFRLCGCMFGLDLPGVGQLRRERWFETSWHALTFQAPHHHWGPAISIAGHGTPAWMRARTGHIGVAEWRQVMGIGWTTRQELTEAIPPAYTELTGRALLDHMITRRAA